MKTISLKNIEKKQVKMEGAEKVWKQLPLSAADGVPSQSWRVFTLEPGGHTPYHTHPYEHMNYIIEGEGALVNAKGKETPVTKGDFVLVDPDEKHNYVNKSPDKTFVMICGVPKEFE